MRLSGYKNKGDPYVRCVELFHCNKSIQIISSVCLHASDEQHYYIMHQLFNMKILSVTACIRSAITSPEKIQTRTILQEMCVFSLYYGLICICHL